MTITSPRSADARGGGRGITDERSPGRPLPVVLLCAVYVVALGGRFTLDRVGLPDLEKVDLRLIGGSCLVVAVLIWRLHPAWGRERHAFAPSIRWALALFALMALSAAWSPPRADWQESLIDLLALTVLVVATALLTAPDPVRGARVLMACAAVSGVVYTVLGLVTGETDVQGRMAVLGGGPNVYVRVVCLGIVATIVFAVIRRSWLLSLVPVMGVAGALSGSRGGVAAAVVAALFFLVVFHRRWSARWLAWLVGVGAVGALLGAVLVGAEAQLLLESRFVGELTGSDDYSQRPELLIQAWRIFLEHPIFGSGLDSYWAEFGGTVDQDYPHNIVAEIAVTVGVVGLAVFAVFLVRLIADCRSRAPLAIEQIGLVVGAVFVLAESMFSGDFYDTRFFWIFAVAVVNLRSWTASPFVRDPIAERAPKP